MKWEFLHRGDAEDMTYLHAQTNRLAYKRFSLGFYPAYEGIASSIVVEMHLLANLVFFMLIQEMILFHYADLKSPVSPLFNAIRILIVIIIGLAWLTNLIWRFAEQRTEEQRIGNIVAANELYGDLINKTQKELFTILVRPAHKHG